MSTHAVGLGAERGAGAAGPPVNNRHQIGAAKDRQSQLNFAGRQCLFVSGKGGAERVWGGAFGVYCSGAGKGCVYEQNKNTDHEESQGFGGVMACPLACASRESEAKMGRLVWGLLQL